MPQIKPVTDYFEIIKKNHEKYLKHNMVTHLEISGGLPQAMLIQKYAEKIGAYQKFKKRYLDNAIQELSTSSKIGSGALAALLGVGTGGTVYYAQQGIPITLGGSLGEVRNVAAAAFSTVLGAGVSYLAYQAWKKNAEGAAVTDYNQFQLLMQEAGFTNEKYAELSKELVKLFHYRECLLLDLKDGADNHMRQELKKEYLLDREPIDQEALNKAIEIYFLDQLNILFQDAFKQIYEIHDGEIKEEIRKKENQLKIITWIREFFKNPAQNEKFTQQMQVEFMNQCLNYLEAKMVEPGFFAKHPYATSTIVGLIAGSIALGLAATVIGGPISIGIVGIGLLVTCMSALATYLTVNKIENLQYMRSKENRGAIQQAIESVTKESIRLSRLIQNVVETTPDDIKQLEKYKEEGENRGFLYHFNLFGKDKSIAMGADSAWIREYASRYRHSKMIEIDLNKQHKEIIEKGQNQTITMQRLLLEMMPIGIEVETPRELKKFIDDTKDYLKKAENQDFITKFELVNKIKQQFLEIVAVTNTKMKLPKELVDFYTLSVKEGGLGGMEQDLEMTRQLAPIFSEDTEADSDHPLHDLLIAAQRFNFVLSQDENCEFILTGDDIYRAILGVPTSSEPIESKINAGNIQKYLNHSFDFLLSLNSPLDVAGINSKEFVLYRMLFIKQLANLADPNNLRVEASVRADIENFAREKLQIDPKVVFDEVLNQALFITEERQEPTIIDPLGAKRSVHHLEQVADALRLDLAYASKSMTPRQLISLEVSDFLLRKGAEKTLFCHNNSKDKLIPSANAAYVSKIADAILITKELIQQMGTKKVLFKTGVLASYVNDARCEIEEIRKLIEAFTKTVSGNSNTHFLHDADKLLKNYQDELEEILATNKPKTYDSVRRYGGFRKRPALDLSRFQQDWIQLEPVRIDPEKLEAFIGSLQGYLSFIEKEPQLSRFNFFSYSKMQKKAAVDDLVRALESKKEGRSVDLSFLDNKIYNNGLLKTIIAEHASKFGVSNIKELFTTDLAKPAIQP